MKHRISLRLMAGAALLALTTLAQASDGPWLLVDTARRTLFVMEAGKVLESYPSISVGRRGVADSRLQGDGVTPLGSFRIAWINPNSRFHRFFGLDYPNEAHVERAYQRKLIDFDIYSRIRRALSLGEVPPQNTALGGYIGIHGTGPGDERMHELYNWTEGCVALTNVQIDRLSQWIDIGTEVTIR